MADLLKRYREKRNFDVTAEPAGGGTANESARAFVVQKHWARRLHYDFRLELDGAMKSWAVPKGPSYDPSVKRMAVQVEDHPLAYNQFEGTIPQGHYGAGKVIIWDEGTWEPLEDPRKGYRQGKLKFALHGRKLQGKWTLVRMRGRGERQQPWLLIKEKDELALPEDEFSVVDEMPDSVVPLRESGRPPAGNGQPDEPVPALPGVAAAMPASLKPQLATLVSGVPRDGEDWLYEVKYDGYRILARLEGGQARLYTRNGHDWTSRLAHLAEDIGKLPVEQAWIDGEIVVMVDGVPSFQALQNAFEARRTRDIAFYVFDLPYLVGRDLRGEPLSLRRDLLQRVLDRGNPAHTRFSQAFDVPPGELIGAACRMGLEGIIGKRRSSTYVSRRSDSWIKLKCGQRQEFVIVGYTPPSGRRAHFGSLVLAVHDDDGKLRFVGSVGSGFDYDMLEDVKRRMDPLVTDRKPIAGKTPVDRRATWIEPSLVAEVSFGEWTKSGHIRQPVFRGLRSDKQPRAISRERPLPASAVEDAPASAVEDAAAEAAGDANPRKAPAKAASRGASVRRAKLTHPERVIDPSTGLTKLDLARYYGLVAPLLVPHLRGRPTAFLRAPSGIHKPLFFQKHLEGDMPGIVALPAGLNPDHPPMIEVPNGEAVMSAAQMNVVEFHTWNAVKQAIGTPDRMLFDLDPGEGVQWDTVRQGALLVQTLLRELGLKAWLKTSGGKGLHVVVPLQKQFGWDVVKGFSQAIVTHLARALPQIFVAKSGPKNRVGRIFADYLRNGFGATTVSAWSARARPGMGISVPIDWSELPDVKSGAQWTIANVHARLDVGNDAWDDYRAQPVARAMKRLGYETPKDGKR